MSKEIDRLTLHHRIIEGKLSIPSNEATRAALSQQLRKIDAQIERLTNPRKEPEKPDPLEREFRLKAQLKRYGKYWSPAERKAQRRRIRELREEADDGIRLPKWEPPTPDEFKVLKERLAVVLAKYMRGAA